MKLKGYVIILLISLSSKNNKTNLLTYKKSKNSSHFCMLKLNENTWYAMLCAIWYHFYNLKNVRNVHEVVLLLVKLQAEACNFTKCNTPPWAFFTFFKLYKWWYQIAQSLTYILTSNDPYSAVR